MASTEAAAVMFPEGETHLLVFTADSSFDAEWFEVVVNLSSGDEFIKVSLGVACDNMLEFEVANLSFGEKFKVALGAACVKTLEMAWQLSVPMTL